MQVMYSFRDRVSGLSSFPFPGSDNRAAIIRAVKTAVNAGGSQPWQMYPRDHELYKVGEFDDATGRVTALDAPEFVLNVSDLLAEE